MARQLPEGPDHPVAPNRLALISRFVPRHIGGFNILTLHEHMKFAAMLCRAD